MSSRKPPRRGSRLAGRVGVGIVVARRRPSGRRGTSPTASRPSPAAASSASGRSTPPGNRQPMPTMAIGSRPRALRPRRAAPAARSIAPSAFCSTVRRSLAGPREFPPSPPVCRSPSTLFTPCILSVLPWTIRAQGPEPWRNRHLPSPSQRSAAAADDRRARSGRAIPELVWPASRVDAAKTSCRLSVAQSATPRQRRADAVQREQGHPAEQADDHRQHRHRGGVGTTSWRHRRRQRDGHAERGVEEVGAGALGPQRTGHHHVEAEADGHAEREDEPRSSAGARGANQHRGAERSRRRSATHSRRAAPLAEDERARSRGSGAATARRWPIKVGAADACCWADDPRRRHAQHEQRARQLVGRPRACATASLARASPTSASMRARCTT